MNYPNKPLLEQATTNRSKSITNIILFLVISYFYFDKNISLVVTVFIILLIHELGHLVAMRLFNYNNLKIFFIPLIGAYASGTKTTISQKQSLLISLAGPLPGILIAIGLYYYGKYYHNNFVYQVSYYMFIINLFNLLPIKPLDGGNIISILFVKSNKAVRLVFMISSVAAMIIVSLYLRSYILLIIPFFISLGLIRQLKVEKIKKILILNGVNLDKTYNELTDQEYWYIRMEIVKSFSFSPKIDPELMQLSSQENKIVKYVKLITTEIKLEYDINNSFRNNIIFVLIISIVIPIYYVKEMKENDPKNTAIKTMNELLSNEEIKLKIDQCIASIGDKVPYAKREILCNCYISELMRLKKADYDRIFSLPKDIQLDSLKLYLNPCIDFLNDTTNKKEN
jgi:stage IV sporulation protein FB